MLFIIILIIIIVICLIILGYIIIRRFSDLKNLDVNSLTSAKQGEAKAKIIRAKFFRDSAKIRAQISQRLTGPKDFSVRYLKKIKEKIIDLESRYKPKNKELKTPLSPKDALNEINELISKNNFAEAEKKIIDLIAVDKKNISAYEKLGDLYFQNKDYDQAEEIYKYLIKLSASKSADVRQLKKGGWEEAEAEILGALEINPILAVYYENLGQIYEIRKQDNKALDCFLKAVSVEPNNPKYLDKLIESSVAIGDRGLAKKTFNRLRQINPQNAKLADFQGAIEKME